MNLFSWTKDFASGLLGWETSMLSSDRSTGLVNAQPSCMPVLLIIIVYHYRPIQMITQNEEKKMLIESMKKLTGHVTGNQQRQRDIFEALSLHDFNKIIANLKDENQYLRRISALFLCELFYRNQQTKEGALGLLAMQPGWGRICLSGIPEIIYRSPGILKKCLELMRLDVQEDQDTKICWLINLERKNLKIELFDYKKYSSFTFIDPAKNIFGFSIPKQSRRPSPQKGSSTEGKRHSVGGHRLEEKHFKRTTDHHNKVISQQQKSKERATPSKNIMSMASSLQPDKRKSISPTSASQYKNKLVQRKQEFNKTTELRNGGSESFKSKFQNSRGFKPSPQLSPKVSITEASESFTNRYTISTSFRNERSSQVGQMGQFGATVGPMSARESSSKEHDRFYHRVKDILHK